MYVSTSSLDSPDPGMPTSAKTIEASRESLAQVIFPKDANELGLANAGVILKSVDIAASLAAGKHSGSKVVTASLDRMDFIHPARIWELVTTTASLTKTWKSSMETEVVVHAENTRTGEMRRVALGYLVCVALDDDAMKPMPVPSLVFLTEEEKRRAEEAEVRKITRLKEQQQVDRRAQTAIDASDFPEEVYRTMTPDDSNIHHNVFGGVILEMIHHAGEKASSHYVNGPVIGVRQDRMSFERPAYIGEEVRAQAIITRTWKTSFEVQVDVVAKDYKTNAKRRIASSYLVYVALDGAGHPRPVTPFEPQAGKQYQRWAEAEARRAIRLKERLSALRQ